MPYPFVRLPQCRKKKLKIQPCYFFIFFFLSIAWNIDFFLTYYINLLYKAYFSTFTCWKSVSNSKKQILIKSLLHENTFWEINCWIYSSLWNASAVTLVYVFSAGCFYKAFLSPTSFNFLPMLPTSALLYYISLFGPLAALSFISPLLSVLLPLLAETILSFWVSTDEKHKAVTVSTEIKWCAWRNFADCGGLICQHCYIKRGQRLQCSWKVGKVRTGSEAETEALCPC